MKAEAGMCLEPDAACLSARRGRGKGDAKHRDRRVQAGQVWPVSPGREERRTLLRPRGS